MTKQDIANLNVLNPLSYRSAMYGGSPMIFEQMDRNLISLARFAENWDIARVPYEQSEFVKHQGTTYVSLAENSDNPTGSANWAAISAATGRGSAFADAPVALGSLTPTFIQLPFAIAGSYAEGVVVDAAIAQTFQLNYRGAWLFRVSAALTFTSPVANEIILCRLTNVSKGTSSVPFQTPVSTSDAGKVLSLPLRADIDGTAADPGNVFIVEVATQTATIAGVSVQNVGIEVEQLGAL